MLTTNATNLPRLMRCIGSYLMPATLPVDYDMDARNEGNAADWLSEELFNDRPAPPGTKAPNGWVVTDDMIEHVHVYLDALHQGGAMQQMTTFAGEGWEVRGRADYISYGDGTLTIDDLKYGWRIVSPVENWTLLAHAIGWCIANQAQPDRVVVRIIQPRPYHADGPVREWEVPNGYAGLVDRYNAISARLSNPDDTLTSGIEQCAKCHARYDCPAFDRMSWNAIDVIESAFSDDMSNKALAYEYEQFQYAEQAIKIKRESVSELMTYRITSGQVIPGFALTSRTSNRAWATGMSGAALSAAAGVDLRKDGIVTPAEAERRGMPKHVVAALTSRATIGVKLERIDADAMARSAFGDRT